MPSTDDAYRNRLAALRPGQRGSTIRPTWTCAGCQVITLLLHLRWPVEDVVEICGVSLRGKATGGHRRVDGSLNIRNMFDVSHRVPDVDRYRVADGMPRQLVGHPLSEVPGSGHRDKWPRPPSTGADNIVVLLESPHKDEYDYGGSGTLTPKGPAQGTTGGSISKHLSGYFNNPPEGQEYIRSDSRGSHVIICNPIQFQTSLHAAKLRLTSDGEAKVWKGIWNVTLVKENFLCRLLWYSPHIIVNACTSKGGGDGLKGVVRRFLEAKSACFPRPCHVYETAHPSWREFESRSGFRYRTRLGPATG